MCLPQSPWKPEHIGGVGAGERAAPKAQRPGRQERKAGSMQGDPPQVTLGREGLASRAATEPCLGSQTLPHLPHPHICSATQTSPTRWWWLRQFPPKHYLGKRKEVRGAGPGQKLPPLPRPRPPPPPPCFYTHHLSLDKDGTDACSQAWPGNHPGPHSPTSRCHTPCTRGGS